MNLKILYSGLKGMFFSVFILHFVLLLKSLSSDALIMVIPNQLGWTLLNTYLYQFIAAAWTGFITPIAFSLLDDSKFKEHINIFINFLLMYTVYFLWISYINGLSLSPLSFGVLFVTFLIMDYWVVYVLQYFVLKHKISSVNNKLSMLENSSFLREGGARHDIQKYPQ